MLKNIPNEVKTIYFETGNLLHINEIVKKVAQTPTEELIESLRVILKDYTPKENVSNDFLRVSPTKESNGLLNTVEDKKELKMTVKVFLTKADKDALLEALNNACTTLDTDIIDSVVVACAGPSECKTDDPLKCLQEVWRVLEEQVEKGVIQSIGVSDIDTQIFISLYNWAKIKPSIVQINLASCCVVPPALQEFTKQNDVQLLTHSDPAEMLPKSTLDQILGDDVNFHLMWLSRYQVHIKCRGVLASKGYIVCCRKPQ